MTNTANYVIIIIEKRKGQYIMKTLINLLDYYISLVKHGDHKTRLVFFNQAFGAVQYHSFLYPSQHSELEKLWNETYKPEFEKYVYGVDGI